MPFFWCRYANSSGYLDWSLSPFKVYNLLDGRAFPAFTSHELQVYDLSGNPNSDEFGNALLFLPFINFSCLEQQFPELSQYLVERSVDEK